MPPRTKLHQPGAAQRRGGGFRRAAPAAARGTGGPAPQRRRSAIRPQHLLVDGGRSPRNCSTISFEPVDDSISRIKDPKSMYPAEFGGKASALINAVTKAGTNTFTEELRIPPERRVRLGNFFQPANEPLPPLRQNQIRRVYGGGPIRLTAVSSAATRARSSAAPRRRSSRCPRRRARRDFEDWPTSAIPLTITTTGVACRSRQSIPANRIDPIAAAFLSLSGRQMPAELPEPRGDEELTRDLHQFSARIDHTFGPPDQLFRPPRHVRGR